MATKYNHNKNIISESAGNKGQLEPGTIVRFKYSGKNVTTPNPLVLVLHSNYNGYLHGINIEYIPEGVLTKLWKMTKLTLAGKIEKLAKLRLPLLKADIGNPQSFYNSRLKKFLRGSLGTTQAAYRTYKVGGVGAVKIVDYRFKGAFADAKRAEAEEIRNK